MDENPFIGVPDFENARKCRRLADALASGSAPKVLTKLLRWSLARARDGEEEARAYAPTVALASSKLSVDVLQRLLCEESSLGADNARLLGKLLALATNVPAAAAEGAHRLLLAVRPGDRVALVHGLLIGATYLANALDVFVDSNAFGDLSATERASGELGSHALALACRMSSLLYHGADLVCTYETGAVTEQIGTQLKFGTARRRRDLLSILAYAGGPQYVDLLKHLLAAGPADEETRLRLALALHTSQDESSDEEGTSCSE